nr:hypothetical protein [Tanacetum cinerariifolium]
NMLIHIFKFPCPNKICMVPDVVNATALTSFWAEGGRETSFCRFMSKEKSDSILKLATKQFFVEKEVASSLDGGSRDDFSNESIERDERRLTEVRRRTNEIEIAMRDITNNTKGLQLDCSRCTFTGLDDDRLSQWGTNFQCFATTRDGEIVVGSLDGKIYNSKQCIYRFANAYSIGYQFPSEGIDWIYMYHRCWKTAIGSALSSLQSLDVSYCQKLSEGLSAVAEVFPNCQKFIQLLKKFEEGFKNTGLPDKHDYEKGKVSRDIAENSIFKELTCSNGVAANE